MESRNEMSASAHLFESRASAATSRRSFIRLVGGGAVLAATGTLAGCSAELPEAAVQPWRSADRESDLRRFMLAHALLAPNPHNLQPWIADLREAGRIHLNCDSERLLPETDPFGRQILIGCGRKSSYANDRALPETLLRSWADTATRFGLRSGVASGAAAMDPIRRITREAYEIEATTTRTWLESARVMRIGPGAIAANPDGISLNSPMVRALYTVGLFDPMEVPVKGTSSLQRVMDRWVPFETASGFLWLASPDNSRAMQVASGRAYVRAHLLATAAGADMHPLSQALQEFPEMRGPFEAIHKTLGLTGSGETLQMLSRVGYATEPRGPSPRRSLDALLRT